MKKNMQLKAACYSMSITMSIVANLPPILFLTFRSLLGLSYSELGLLVLINFSTQLVVDLIFSFFSDKFNIRKTIRLMPWLAFVGVLIYAFAPFILAENPFLPLLLGTAIFSAAAGLAEVLLSPIIAALPSDNPERDMSKLHSIYAWGVVGVVIAATLLLRMIGNENWVFLMALSSFVPLASAILFAGAEIPEPAQAEKSSGAFSLLKKSGVWLCVGAIFLGGAAEITMSQWASGYLEQGLGIPKALGDVFGAAMFGATLGLGRTLYAKIGKNIMRVLVFGAVGASACYILAAVTPYPILGLFACAFTGFCTSMMWPGSLVVAAERFPSGGVVIYAIMAAAGDLGASVVPQLVGWVTDVSMASKHIITFATQISMSAEQLAMRMALLVGALFPLAAIFVFYVLSRKTAKDRKRNI